MGKKSAHPDIRLFDYLNCAVDAEAARVVEAHLSTCSDCASVAALVRQLKGATKEAEGKSRSHISNVKSQISDLKSQISGEHPDVSELASFFYARSRRADSSPVAAHVAVCNSCSEEIAQYARADRAAYNYKLTKSTQTKAPAKAWEMIHDWEGSSFAKFKPASEVLGQELLTRLSHLLNDREVDADVTKYREDRVPVLIVSNSGNVRSVEFFERVVDDTGTSILKHAEGSDRFDNKPVHVLLDFGEKERVVISDLIRSDTIRLQEPARTERQPQRVDYFIIEDSKD